MRATVVIFVALLWPAAVAAQSPPCQPLDASTHRLGFDPYNPSQLAIVRNFGGAALSHTPIDALLKLDPYVPTEAALLRQVGGGLPFWAYVGLGAAHGYGLTRPAGDMTGCGPERRGADIEPPAAPITTFQEMFARLHEGPDTSDASPRVPSARQTPGTRTSGGAAVPEVQNAGRGITVLFDQRQWMSAGPAVRLRESEFSRLGDLKGSAVYRAVQGSRDVIFISTVPGMVAPFRLVR